MSFILDALKKLEQKRQQGAVPDLMTIHLDGRTRPGKRRLWPVLVTAALVLNAVVLVLVFAPWKSNDQAMVAQAVPGNKASDSKMIPLPQNAPESSLPPLPSTSTGSAKSASVNAPDVLPAAPGMKPSYAQAAPASPSMPESTPASSTPDDAKALEQTAAPLQEEPAEPMASARLDLSVQELDDLKQKLADEQLAPEPDISADPVPSVQEREAPGDRTIEFSDLPSDIKSGLPELTIAGHIFSNSPQSRLVNINGSVLREGERVSGDLTVDEITLSGVIFTYRGYRFLMRAF